MGRLAPLWGIATSWYVSLIFLAGLGILIGYLVFFNLGPGKPKIGVIDIPFTVITDNSAYQISAFLDYARRDDSIKAVVIRLNSPGGGAAASEHLYLETRKLREEKPVVIIMNDIVASGGFMMAMGANYTYAKPSSLVGNVGVVLSFPGPLIPQRPSEQIVTTGPMKLAGGSRRDWIALADQLKYSFGEMVVAERGDRLRISAEDVLQARIYSGTDAVRLGLADAIGGDTEAIQTAARLAGISRYELVDVNVEVARIFTQKSQRARGLDGSAAPPGLVGSPAFRSAPGDAGNPFPSMNQGEAWGDATSIQELRRLFISEGIGQDPDHLFPELPLKINGPNIYYLYVGPNQ